MSNLSPIDAYIMARWYKKMDLSGLTPESELVRHWLKKHPVMDGKNTWLKALLVFEFAGSDIFEQNPEGEPPKAKQETRRQVSVVPELPKRAQLSPHAIQAAQNVGTYVDRTLRWLVQRSPMTPILFLEAALLTVIGMVIARRLVLRLDSLDVFPHDYVLWIASTSYYRKSTGLSVLKAMMSEAAPHLLLPSSMTPEMIIYKLAGGKPTNFTDLPREEQDKELAGRKFAGQRGIIADEATAKFFSTKKYMEGFSEVMMEMYDSPSLYERETKIDGKLIIREPALCIIGSTTPIKLGRSITDSEWEDGYLARFVLLSPQEGKVKRKETSIASGNNQIPPEYIQPLKKLYSALPLPDPDSMEDSPQSIPALNCLITPEALGAWNAYSDAMHEFTEPNGSLPYQLVGNYSRFPVQALKQAMRLAGIDWAQDGGNGVPRIEIGHWAKAQSITEHHRASAHRALDELLKGQEEKLIERIISLFDHNPDKPLSVRDLARLTHKSSRVVADALNVLVDDGDVQIVTIGKKQAYTLAK